MKCRKHPKYKAIRKPRVLCPGCWWIWILEADRPSLSSYIDHEDEVTDEQSS